MRHRFAIGVLVGAALLFSGCATSQHAALPVTDSDLARRAAALRGATDSQWEAIRYAHEQGKPVDSKYVFAIAEFRMGALRAQTMAVIGTDEDRRETDKWLKEAEATLPKVIAEGPARQQAAK